MLKSYGGDKRWENIMLRVSERQGPFCQRGNDPPSIPQIFLSWKTTESTIGALPRI